MPRFLCLKERIQTFNSLPNYIKKFSLLVHLSPVYEILDGPDEPLRPGYFDFTWSKISFDMDYRIEGGFGFELRNAGVPDALQDEYLSARYSSSKLVFTGGTYFEN